METIGALTLLVSLFILLLWLAFQAGRERMRKEAVQVIDDVGDEYPNHPNKYLLNIYGAEIAYYIQKL